MNKELSQRYLSARTRCIEKELAFLNPEQRRAVMTVNGPLLLLAGAGSGKTTVLVQRIAHILRYGDVTSDGDTASGIAEEDLRMLESAAEGERPFSDELRSLCAGRPVYPWQILAITFTNKAADEMKTRLRGILGEPAGDIWACTFHKACVRILRRDADRLGFTNSFTIYDTSDCLSVMKTVLQEMDLDEKQWQPRVMLAEASMCKNSMVSAEENLREAEASGEYRRVRAAQIILSYCKKLRAADAMDFDDLLFYAVLLLRENEDILRYYQNRFRYILIDEYQDTNHIQYVFASLLSAKYRNLCVVGDDDQSIYKFRGATIRNILSFEEQYPDATVIRLEQNYRSAGNILQAANAVISNNTHRKGKELWSTKPAGDKITLYIAEDENGEALFIADTVGRSPRPSGDFAVLYRTNAQSRAIEMALKRRGISYKVYGGLRFFDRAEVKDILSYLSVIANPTDETRLLRIVNTPPRGIGKTSLDRIREYAEQKGVSLYEAMSAATQVPGVSAAKKMEAFCSMIGVFQDEARDTPLTKLLDDVLLQSGYYANLQGKNDEESLSRLQNIEELKTSMMEYSSETGNTDLYSYLDEVALYTDLDTYENEESCVVLMTIHSAKGLEFPVVFLAGAEEGLFPGIRAIGSEEDMEEERRLCYVAVTRAKEKLYITCAAHRTLYGKTNASLPSRFTDEIPPALLETKDATFRSHAGPGYRDLFGTGFDSFSFAPRRTPAARFAGGAAKPEKPASAPVKDPGKKTQTTVFSVGDRVIHKAFGPGVVEKKTPMGGDALLEVLFENGGTKKLMQKIASQFMNKRNE